MRRVNQAAGAMAVSGGILLFLVGWQLGVGSAKLPGAGFFPLLIACSLAGLGAWLLLRPGRPGSEETIPPAGPPRWRSLAIALVSIAGYAAALNAAGYLLCTFALLLIQLRWVEEQKWRISLSTAVLASTVSLVLFRVALKVPLPLGLIPLPPGW